MSEDGRVSYDDVEGADEFLTPGFLGLLVELHDRFNTRVQDVRNRRAELISRALNDGVLPSFPPPSEINSGDWKVPPVPEDLRRPGIEISGPVSITNMAINALNPGPGGQRAQGYLDDDEDSGGHRLVDTLNSTRNRLNATLGTLYYYNEATGREYKVEPGELPFFMHRERGLHLDEPGVRIDGKPVSATLLGLGLTFSNVGKAQVERGQGLYFYLPKMEVVEEAELYRDVFAFASEYLGYPEDAVIRAIPLIESLPAVYIMDELLYALGPYAAGLNAARWDLKASILEFIMADESQLWPDRFGVDIKTTEFMSSIFRRLVSVCHRRGAVPIGGMATALPSRDDEVNQAAAASIRADKVWEADQGFIRAWVAHIFHMQAAAQPFKEYAKSGKTPEPATVAPDHYKIDIVRPEGPVTLAGTHRNARMLIEYVEGWLAGRGAKGIDSLEGKPGIHPALMEDLATGRISVAQLAQRIIHKAVTEDTEQVHDFALVKQALKEELEDILEFRKAEVSDGDDKAARAYARQEERYHKAYKVAMQWVRNYSEYNYRSLGSYTHTDFDKIAAAPDAI
jgi:malate synthase